MNSYLTSSIIGCSVLYLVVSYPVLYSVLYSVLYPVLHSVLHPISAVINLLLCKVLCIGGHSKIEIDIGNWTFNATYHIHRVILVRCSRCKHIRATFLQQYQEGIQTPWQLQTQRTLT